jgi:hypothetical protein
MLLGKVTECDTQGCYMVGQENHGLAIMSPEKKSQPKLVIERQLDNKKQIECGVTVFGDDETIEAIGKAVNRYPIHGKTKDPP